MSPAARLAALPAIQRSTVFAIASPSHTWSAAASAFSGRVHARRRRERLRSGPITASSVTPVPDVVVVQEALEPVAEQRAERVAARARRRSDRSASRVRREDRFTAIRFSTSPSFRCDT